MGITGEAWNEAGIIALCPNSREQPDEDSFLLSVEEAADRYAAAGHPRTTRAARW